MSLWPFERKKHCRKCGKEAWLCRGHVDGRSLRTHYSSSTSVVRRFIIDKSRGKKDQVGVFIDSNEEGARRFCFYIIRRGFGAMQMSSENYEGYEWFTYATYRGLNKEQIVKKILPHCERKTDNVIIVDEKV